jgi:uncharacterized coiled-coil protein SlyX
MVTMVNEYDIIAKFATKSLTIINGEPNYTQLRQLRSEVYGNVTQVPTAYGGGAHGHLGAVMPDAAYVIKTGHLFVIPADPGEYDTTIPGNAGTANRARLEAAHTAAKLMWDTCRAVKTAAKNQIIAAIDPAYLDEIRDDELGFLLSSPEDIISHLFDRYGEISEYMITENMTTIEEPFDPTLPFATFTRRLEKCNQLATDAGTAYSDAQMVQIAIIAITATGLFTEGYLRWNRLPTAQKTWATFKTHFNREHVEWRNLSKMTARQAGFGANAATTGTGGLPAELSEAFDNLAMAAATDKSTVDALTQQLAAMQAEVSRLNEDNRRLSKIMESMCGQTGGTAQPPPSQPADRKKAILDPKGYCWTHGYRVSIGHSGTTCTKQAEGHVAAATRANTMGGSTNGKPRA